MKLFTRVGIAAFLAVCVMMWAGCSWADEEEEENNSAVVKYHSQISFIHNTKVDLVDGKPQYDSTQLEELFFSFWLFSDTEDEESSRQWPVSGEIAIVPEEANLVVRYYDVDNHLEWSQEYPAKKPVSFDLYSNGSDATWDGGDGGYYLASADVNGQQRAFFRDDDVEKALSEDSYTFKFNIDNSNISGKGTLPKIHTSADYTGDGRVPYVRPVSDDDGKIDKLKYGFVNPTTQSFADGSATDIRIAALDISLVNDGGSFRFPINIYEGDGNDSENESNLYDGTEEELLLNDYNVAPIELEKIGSLLIEFEYLSEEASNTGDTQNEDEGGSIPTSVIFYYWKFNNVSAERDNQEPQIVQVTPAELNAIDAASGNLNLTEIVPVDFSNAEICTNTDVEFRDSGIASDRTVSAISVAQAVEPGGAVVLGSMELPVHSRTIDDYFTLEPPKDFADLRSKYKVLKGFSRGYTIDLLAKFGADAVSYDIGTNSVILTAAIVIINDEAPDDNLIVKPYDKAPFGVKSKDLGGDLKVLYIYDGIKDNEARDPIALVVNEVNPDSGSSGPSRPSNPPVDSQPTEPDDELPPDSDYNTPPEGKDTTEVRIDLNSENKGIIVRLAVTLDGRPIPAGIPFRIWLFPNQDTAKAAAPSYIGPFMVESGEGVLEIDVNNLKKPDGSKASISKGSYVIKFSDDEGKYIGTTPSVELEATGTQTPPVDEGNEKTGSSSGGCDAGWGLFGLLLAGFAALKFRKA